MRQRLAIAVSSLVAAAVLAVGLSAAGFGPNARTVAVDDVPETVGAGADEQTETTDPEVVYVKPAPSPKTVVKVKQARSKDDSRTTRRTTRARSEERDDDHDDDHDEREWKRERRESRERDDDDDRDEHEREDD
jgi:hypothetical protein